MTTKRRSFNLGLLAGPALLPRGRRDGEGRVRAGPATADTGPIQPQAGTWRTWLLTSGSQLRPSAAARPGGHRGGAA